MQLHVCFLLAAVVAAAVQEEPRNSTEEHATRVPNSNRDFPSPSQAGSDYTSTQEPSAGSGSQSGPATPLSASGSRDSEALQLPEEVGNNGAETSVTRLLEPLVLTRNTQTNPGMREGTRGSHTSGRSTFPPVTSSPTRWTLLATPAGTMETVYLQNFGRTSSNGMEVFSKRTSDLVWGSTWSQTDLPKSTERTTRLPDASSRITGSTGTSRDATMVSGRIQNSSQLEDGTGMARLASHTKTESGRVRNFGDSEDGLGTPSFTTHVRLLRLGGSRVGTRATDPLPHASTTLVSGGVQNLTDSKDQSGPPQYKPQLGVLSLGFSEKGTGTLGQSPRASTILSSGGDDNASSHQGMGTPELTPHVGVLSTGGSKDRTGTAGQWSHMSSVTVSEGFMSLGGSQDETNMLGRSPQVKVLSSGGSEGRTGTPGHSLHMSTMLVSGSENVLGMPQSTHQVGVLNLGGSQDGTATPENGLLASTVLVSRGDHNLSGSEAARLRHTSPVAVSSLGGSEDLTGTSGHSPRAITVTASGGFFGVGGSQNTDDTLDTTPMPTTLKNRASVSPSILDVLTRAYTPTAPPSSTQETLTTEVDGARDGNTVTTRQRTTEAQTALTPLSSATSRLPKVYVVPDQPATMRVTSIEVLLQIVVDDASSASGPDLEEDTSAWAEPYLQRAPGFSRMLGVWGSGRAVQMLLEFDSLGALRWLSASGASTLLRQTGLDGAARQGRSFRGSKVLNVTLGGVQADVCDWLLGCPAGFRCVSRPSNNFSCSSVCHFDFCHHHGVCTHHPRQLPVCRCLVGEDFWFMGSRCDVRMTRARLACTCASVLVLAVAVMGSLAFVAVRRYRAALIRAKVDQTRSSYRRFNHFDELSSRFWPRSASAASADSMDNPAFTRSDELLHMRALDRPCCYHDDTLSLASASTGRAAGLNTIYPDSSQYGWCGSELSAGDGVLDSGKASDLSVCSWPVEPIHWTPFPLLRQLAAPRPPHAARASRPRSYCSGMELVDVNRSWTA